MFMKKGAEADLYQDLWYGLKIVKKIRRPKAYRIPQLDFEIRRSRTIREAQMIHDAKLVGVSTPFIYWVDMEATTIIMQYIEGYRVKESLDSLSPDDRGGLCERIGMMVGKLHSNGIIHGDLTTSNMIVARNDSIVLIDFGLAEYSKELEKRGVDLLLLRRSLQATHYLSAKQCLNAIIIGYASVMGEKIVKDVKRKIREIIRRGRYARSVIIDW